MADRARRMVQLAGAGAARYTDEEVDETVAFLEWLLHDNFIFLGYREYRFRDDAISVVPDSGLGILADAAGSTYAKPVPVDSLPPGVRERALEGDLLIVSKTNRLSRVHRPRADGLHRRAADLARRRDRRRGADARPVHHQGLQPSPRARRRCCTASCARSCAPRT